MSQFNHGDCMQGLKDFPDGYFDLAIVDPPYGLEAFRTGRKNDRIDKLGKIQQWDRKPDASYFKELFRVSKKQIIWGANNFSLPTTEYFIVWDKMQTVDNFASAEYAWTNVKKPAQVFRYAIHKVMAERKFIGGKIHPTQKPVALYEWLLKNYASPGDRILDTHVGSGTSLVACYNLGFEYVGYEIDEHYYKLASQHLNARMAQMDIFHYLGNEEQNNDQE
jgi:site-specific DNA-methyltransferase (adenine-specific)